MSQNIFSNFFDWEFYFTQFNCRGTVSYTHLARSSNSFICACVQFRPMSIARSTSSAVCWVRTSSATRRVQRSISPFRKACGSFSIKNGPAKTASVSSFPINPAHRLLGFPSATANAAMQSILAESSVAISTSERRGLPFGCV